MDVRLPNLGEGADSGTVVNVFVKEGDKVEKDQPLIELENEKAVATIPSTAAGVISKIHVKNGDKISVGQRIISLSGSAGADAAPVAAAKPKPAAAAPQPVAELPEIEAPAGPVADMSAANESVAAAPSLRQMANELGIDLTRIRGSERGGRIVLADIRNHIQRLGQAAQSGRPMAAAAQRTPVAEPIDFSKWGAVRKQPMSNLRKVISRRMLESWNTVPQVTQFDDADLTTVLALRSTHLAAYEKKGARLTVTGFVLKAVVAVLKKHPIFNASLDDASEEIVFKDYYHLGIAVDSEAGLMVPVIRDVDKKSLVQLSQELEELAKKVRERKVSAEELKGGTFTISNQGGIGSAHFTPIVNKPEVAILGLGQGALKPVVKDKKIEQLVLLPLALSYNHRVIDGGAAARFMVELVAAIEQFDETQVKL